MQVGNSGGWNYQGITGYNKVSENGEYVFFRNTNTAPETTDDGGVYIRIDYISGGKITVSEVRAYDVPDSGLTEPLPWYPSKWENESIYSEIKQTADSISLKVAGWQGGTNLLPRSKFSESVKGWNVNGSPTYGITTFGGEKCLYLSGSVSGAGIWQKDYMPIQYKVKGCQFTVSFDVYNKFNAKSLRIGLEGSLSSELSVNILNIGVSGWTRVAKTITYNNIATDSFIIYTDYDNYPTVCVKNVKIEFGPYATNYTENEKDVLLSTGVDIFNKKLVLTADNTLIQSNDGQQIAMFTVKNGKPLLKAENIDVDKLIVKQINGNETTIGSWKIIEDGVFECAITEKIKIRISPGFDFIHVSDEGSYQNFKIYKDGSGVWKLTIADYSGSCDYTAEGLLPDGGNGSWKYSHDLKFKDGNRFYNVGIDSSGYLKLLDF